MHHTLTEHYLKAYLKPTNLFTSLSILDLIIHYRHYLKIPANILTSFNLSNNLGNIH